VRDCIYIYSTIDYDTKFCDERKYTSLRVNEYDRSAKDYKECFDIWGIPAHDKATFPKEVPGFKAAIDDFRDSFRNLAKKVFRSFALYLDLDDTDFFINKHKAFLEDPAGIQSHNLIRSNFYPPIPADSSSEINENTLRLTEHSDLDTCSFLFQDEVGGLEAKMTNGEWVPVPPIKDSIVFNTGFCLELWSGGVFPSTVSLIPKVIDPTDQKKHWVTIHCVFCYRCIEFVS
jgi:isopenicillin N synthase-like dioxygenase